MNRHWALLTTVVLILESVLGASLSYEEIEKNYKHKLSQISQTDHGSNEMVEELDGYMEDLMGLEKGPKNSSYLCYKIQSLIYWVEYEGLIQHHRSQDSLSKAGYEKVQQRKKQIKKIMNEEGEQNAYSKMAKGIYRYKLETDGTQRSLVMEDLNSLYRERLIQEEMFIKNVAEKQYFYRKQLEKKEYGELVKTISKLIKQSRDMSPFEKSFLYQEMRKYSIYEMVRKKLAGKQELKILIPENIMPGKQILVSASRDGIGLMRVGAQMEHQLKWLNVPLRLLIYLGTKVIEVQDVKTEYVIALLHYLLGEYDRAFDGFTRCLKGDMRSHHRYLPYMQMCEYEVMKLEHVQVEKKLSRVMSHFSHGRNDDAKSSMVSLRNEERTLLRQLYKITHLHMSNLLSGDHQEGMGIKLEPAGLLRKYCFDCHNEKKDKGGVNMKVFLGGIKHRNAQVWRDAIEQMHEGEMPPEEEEQPTEEEKESMVEWLTEAYQSYQNSIANRKEVSRFRRLTGDEYVYTMQDLFGNGAVDRLYELKDLDGDVSRSAYEIPVSRDHLSVFLKMADRSLANIIHPFEHAPQPVNCNIRVLNDIYEFNEEMFRNHYRPIKGGLGILQNADTVGSVHSARGEIRSFKVATAGMYRIKVKAMATGNEKIKMGIGRRYDHLIEQAKQTLNTSLFSSYSVGSKYKEYSVSANLKKGDLVVVQRLSGKRLFKTKDLIHEHKRNDTFLVIKDIHIEGPFYESWPNEQFKSMFGPASQRLSTKESCVKDMLAHFMGLVYRRSPTHTEIKNLMKFYHSRLSVAKENRRFHGDVWTTENGYPQERRSLDAVVKKNNSYLKTKGPYKVEHAFYDTCIYLLTSTNFLYHIEKDDRPSQFSLASRLSYLLWLSMPDEGLYRLLDSIDYRSEKGVMKAIEYCMTHPKFDRYIKSFCMDWLELSKLGTFSPDKILYPNYSKLLEEDMLQQTVLFFKSILKNGDSIDELFNGNWTMLNERLAKHYGIDGVVGEHFRKVDLKGDDQIRGSVIGHGSILTATSNGVESLPVERGVWVLKNLLGITPPPPPDGVPPLDPDTRGTKTKLEQLEAHRKVKSCRSCHLQIDPYGIALENFDATGGWRNHYSIVLPDRKRPSQGARVESTHKTSKGYLLEGPMGLKNYLGAQKKSFTKALVKQVIEYTLRRPVNQNDRKIMEEVYRDVAKDKYRLKSLILHASKHKSFTFHK